MTRITGVAALAALAMIAGVTTPALATHNHPKKAKFVDVWLVRAYLDCTSPTLTHDSPLAFPACVPTPFSTSKTFGPLGWGRAKYWVFPAAAANGIPPATDVRVSAHLVDVHNGVPPIAGGSLTLTVQLRITEHRCGGLPCTMASIPFPINVPCGPANSLPAGVCDITTTFNTAVPGVVIGFTQANVEFGQVQVFDGPDLVFVQGTYWP